MTTDALIAIQNRIAEVEFDLPHLRDAIAAQAGELPSMTDAPDSFFDDLEYEAKLSAELAALEALRAKVQ